MVFAAALAALLAQMAPMQAYATQGQHASEDAGSEAAGESSVLRTLGTSVDWTTCGTCEWSIDETGLLTIRPANGASTGTLETWSGYDTPWRSYRLDITAVYVEAGVVAPGSMDDMFYGCTSLVSADLSNLDTSSTTSMEELFYSCTSLASADVSFEDTSRLTSMYAMFCECNSLTDLDLSSFDTSRVTDFSYMVESCTSLEGIDLSSFDTSSATSMSYMFEECHALESLDVSTFDTSGVRYMQHMFGDCTALVSLDLSNFDTSCVTNMSKMFSGCTSLRTLDVSSFNTVLLAAAYKYGMFEDCTGLRTVTFGANFVFYSATSYFFSTYECLLPVPYDEDYGEGRWRDDQGVVYEDPADIPSQVAATYTAVFEVEAGSGEYVALDDDATDADSLVFTDVQDASKWYYDAVYAVADLGLLTGYTGDKAGLFGVGDTMTRAQLAVVMWRIDQPQEADAYTDEVQASTTNQTGMDDVVEGAYYTAAANWAVSAGVINGKQKSDGTRYFDPKGTVTFEQLCTVLANYLDSSGRDALSNSRVKATLSEFSDAGKVSSWARQSVAWCVCKDMVNGNDDGTLAPKTNVKRERAAAVFYNAVTSGVLAV